MKELVGYCDIDELKARVKAFGASTTKYASKDLLSGIAAGNSKIKIYLRKGKYSEPITSVATWLLSASSNPTEGQTVIIGETYTFKATPASNYDVDIGADVATSMKNLEGCIENNRYGTYYADTPINEYLGAKDRDGSDLTIFSRRYGPQGAHENVTAGTAPITVTAVETGGEEFPLLVDLNIYLSTIVLFAGNMIGKGSGKTARPLIADFKDEADSIIQLLEAGETLEASSGETAKKIIRQIYIDEDTPDE